MGDEPATVEEALALLKERPDDAELYQQLGGLYFQRGERMQAWHAFMQSLRLNPDDPWTCMKFGTLLTICDDKQYAKQLFDRAIELEPGLAVAHWCSADLHRKQGEYALAERGYGRAVEVDPDDRQAQARLGEWRVFIAGFAELPPSAGPDAEPGAAPGPAARIGSGSR